MFFLFLTSEEVSHFPNQHFYFIFEKLDKVSFSMQFITSQTFFKSITLVLIYFLTFVKKKINLFVYFISWKKKKNNRMSVSLVDYNPVDLYSDPAGIFSIQCSLGFLTFGFSQRSWGS